MAYTFAEILTFILLLVALWFGLYKGLAALERRRQRRRRPPPRPHRVPDGNGRNLSDPLHTFPKEREERNEQ